MRELRDDERLRVSGSLSSERLTSRRPDVFRALGRADPPERITVGGVTFLLVDVKKCDSWAITAVYAEPGGRRIACKFNRSHPLPLGIPAAWLGRRLAAREERVLREMHDHPGFPRWAGMVEVDGRPWPNAVTHHWIEGQPFNPFASRVDDHFFPTLRDMLAVFHSRGMAYVDMSKWENLLVGADGKPYLLDYQIHFRAGRGWLSKVILRWLQEGDRYYFRRHWRRCRPDQVDAADLASWTTEPPHIWIAERLGPLFRGLRIIILRLSGVHGDPRRRDPPMNSITIADTDDAIVACFSVMHQLRPHLKADAFVARVRVQEANGYHLASLTDDGVVRCVAGYRFIENLYSGRVLYVDDLVTDDTVRSKGYGKAMLDWLLDQAKAERCDTFELDSGVQRFDAHRFYLVHRMAIVAHHFRMKL